MNEKTKFKIEFEGKLWERKHLIYYLYTNQEKYGNLSYQEIAELVSTKESTISKQRVGKIIDEWKQKEKSKEISVTLKSNGNLDFRIHYQEDAFPTDVELKELLVKNIFQALDGVKQIREELRGSDNATLKDHAQFELNVLKTLGPYASLLEKGNKT